MLWVDYQYVNLSNIFLAVLNNRDRLEVHFKTEAHSEEIIYLCPYFFKILCNQVWLLTFSYPTYLKYHPPHLPFSVEGVGGTCFWEMNHLLWWLCFVFPKVNPCIPSSPCWKINGPRLKFFLILMSGKQNCWLKNKIFSYQFQE